MVKWYFIDPSVRKAAKKTLGFTINKAQRQAINRKKQYYKNAAKAATVIGLCALGATRTAERLPRKKKWW